MVPVVPRTVQRGARVEDRRAPTSPSGVFNKKCIWVIEWRLPASGSLIQEGVFLKKP